MSVARLKGLPAGQKCLLSFIVQFDTLDLYLSLYLLPMFIDWVMANRLLKGLRLRSLGGGGGS
jgi:hypothetical protein